MLRFGIEGKLCVIITSITRGSVGMLGGGEVVYEVGYVCVLFPGDCIF